MELIDQGLSFLPLVSGYEFNDSSQDSLLSFANDISDVWFHPSPISRTTTTPVYYGS